jgi:hypothetical protein
MAAMTPFMEVTARMGLAVMAVRTRSVVMRVTTLKGKELACHDDRPARVRRPTLRRGKGVAPDDPERPSGRIRVEGEIPETDPRWMLYHPVERFAAHEGRIGLLRRLYRDRRK